jgi:tRNA(Arg) A34 adenosine deaminase TadA
MTDDELMRHVLDLAVDNVERGHGGPFAAAVARDGAMIATGTNCVTPMHDPTAHAEMMAIRKACEIIGDFELRGCTLVSTCEPCPMCLGAIYWARLDRVLYAATRTDAARAGFDDQHIYDEVAKAPSERQIPMERLGASDAHRPFEAWAGYDARVEY